MRRKEYIKFFALALMLALLTVGFACNRDGNKTSITDCPNSSDTCREDSSKVVDEALLSVPPVEIQKTVNLNVYYPNFNKVDLVCGDMPSKDDPTIIMMGAAAFTQSCLDEFAHSNIVEDHVSGGKWYDGPDSKRCTGTFVYYDGKPGFYYKDDGTALKTAANKGGSGFKQEMMIHSDTIVPHKRADDNVNEFRALCMVDGKLAVVDSNKAMKFGDFIKSLMALGASEAIYMDMGGWNYSWFREQSGNVKEIHSGPTPYGTNWLIFYRSLPLP